MDVAVAPGPLLEQVPDRAPYVRVAVRLPAGQAAPPVLVRALRYPQESGDRAEGQGGLPPQSLAELALAPVRDRSRVPPGSF